MFEQESAATSLHAVQSHDFRSDPAHEIGAHRIDAITALDRVIRSAQAEQSAQIATLYGERLEVMPLGHGDASLSVIGEVAMARNISPSAAGTQFGIAIALGRMPLVATLFASGSIPETVVRAVVRESCSLSVDDIVILDGELAPLLPGLTPTLASQATARAVIRIDSEAARVRAERNRADCRMSMFPDTDGVAILQFRGPAEQMVAVHDALDAWAQGLRSTGDPRTVGQIHIETLVERVTGAVRAESIDVEIGLVMGARTLLAGGDEPAELTGYGPLSPDVADDIIARANRVSVRRLLTDPVDGTLIARDARRRRFDGPLAGHIRARDRRCRQPGCDCKIRELDHIIAFENGGPTTADNGQGLCRRSHTLKHQPGWKVTTKGRTATWTTPTGHTYTSAPPPLLNQDKAGQLRQ